MLDQELVDDFNQQIEEQSDIVKKALETLNGDLSNSEAFVECGQVVDRIYGAISMFGFPELSEYLLKLKEMSYKCSNSDPEHEVLRTKCMNLIEVYHTSSALFISVLSSAKNAAQINQSIALETKKVDKILMSYLHGISGGSTGYDDTRTYIYVYDKLGIIQDHYKRMNKELYPAPKFFNAYAGLKKAIKENHEEISGIILDVESDSWELVLKEIREQNPIISIFVTAKNKRLMSSIDSTKLKVQGVFLNHIKYTKFITEFEKIEQRAKTAEAEANETTQENTADKKYTKVSIDVFKRGLPSPFDVYLKINDEKYLKVIKKGEGVDPEQVEKHSQKNIEQYYIDQTDFDEYHSSLNDEIKKILDDPNLNIRQKQRVALDYADNVTYLLETKGVDEKSLVSAKQFVEMSEKIVSEVAQSNDLVKDFLSDLRNMERGSILAMLSGLFLNKMKANQDIHQDVALICFLHDIALAGSPAHVKEGNLELMSEEEKEVFMRHPKKGAQTLAEVGLKPALLEAVIQHHVRIDNSGFPQLPKGQKINSIAELIGLCDDFSKVLEECDETGEDPVIKFKTQMNGRFSKKLVDVFSLTFASPK